MADKDYSVNIKVGVDVDETTLASSKKKLESFQQAVQKALFDGAPMKFAVGGYSMESMEQLLLEAMKSGPKGKGAERKLQQIADDFGDALVGVVDLVEEKELDAKRQLNEIAQRYARMIGVEFISEFAKSIGQPDFMLPAPEGSKVRAQTIQDFIPGKDGMPVISPAMFIDAIERAIANNPELLFGKGPARGVEAGLSRGELNRPFFESAIPEMEDKIKEDFFDLLDRATDSSNSEAVGNYLKEKVQAVLDEIFRRGYEAREATFRSAGVTEGEDAAENLVRYADASARAAIARAEEEFGLQLGTLAKNIRIAGSQYFDFDAASVVGDGNRVPSDPNVLRQVVYGDYNDPFTGTLMSTMQPDRVPDIMEQVFNNPAIIASGQDGIQGLFTDLAKFITPTAIPEFNFEGYRSGLERVKKEIEASGQQFILAFDTEFNQKLPQVITEASIGFRDAAGEFQEVLGFVQAPPSSDYGLMQQGSRESGGVAVGSFKDLAKRAAELGFDGDIGAKDFQTNFMQFYARMQALSGVLKIAAELDIPIAGSNIQGADYDKLAKAIKYINDKIVELGLELPKLEYPINQTLLDTRDIVNKAAKSNMPTAQALRAETLPTGFGKKGDEPLRGANVENILRNLVAQFPEALGANLERIELKPGGGFKIDGLDAHFARADNQAVLIIAEAFTKFEDLVAFMQTKVATDYQPKKKEDKQLAAAEAAAGGSGGGLDARRAAAEAEDSARRRFLTERELAAQIKDLTEAEKKQVITGLERLAQTREHKKLVETEKSLKENILVLEKRLKEATTTEQKRDALKALIAEKSALEELVAVGKKLEIQKRDQIKDDIRGKDVKDRDLQTTAKQIDEMNRLRSTTSGVGREIVGQLKEQAAAAKEVEKQTRSLVNQWVTGRYALYDVGNAYAAVSRQLWQASRQIFNISQSYRSYETAFTSVERAIQPMVVSIEGAREESQSLKQAFIDLSEQIPISFEEISRIATLGAQMGVSASGIVGFTEVVAQFASVTGVAADTVAQKFGRIAELANVDYSEFSNLGSAVLFAGMNAVATEPEILTLSESIAAVSTQAGMLPGEIVGMATALASTGIQAEQARGVFTRVFADIDRVVSKGGSGLDNFAKIAGMSSEDFAAAWGTEGASYDVFRAILGGLGATEDLTAAFDSLNIVETREINTLTRLAENLNVVDQAISDANGSFEAGAFLGDTFGMTVDNLDAKIAIFNNNLKSLMEQLSKGLAGSIEKVIGPVNYMLSVFKEMAKIPLFSYLTGGSLAVTALGAAATLGISAFAKLTAQIYAFRVAAINTANNADVINGQVSMLKQLTGWGSGLIEMRDQLKGAAGDVRGVITPINIDTFSAFGDAVDRLKVKIGMMSESTGGLTRVQEGLLKKSNIYLANSVEEADAITRIIATRKEQIAQIEMETAHKATHLARTQEEIDAINLHNAALDKERASRLAALGGAQIYIATVNGETKALTANEIARLRGIATSQKVAPAKAAEAAAILATAKALDIETASAAKANTMKLGASGILAKGAGIAAGVLMAVTTISTVVSFISAAIEKTKINLLEAGGGVASLRDAIKQDTLEYNKLTAAQKASTDQFNAITVKTKENTAAINPNAQAIGVAAGASKTWIEGNKTATEQINNQTIALGKNTKEWALNAMMQDENLQAALKLDPNLLSNLEKYGTSFQEIIDGIFADPNGNQTSGLEAALKEIELEIDAITADLDVDQTGPKDDAALKRLANLQAQQRELKTTIATVQSLAKALQEAIASGDVWGVIRGMLGLEDAINETDESAQDLTQTMEGLRTVLDYASDLSGILSRIVELNFGAEISRDEITKGWRDIAKSATDAKDAVTEANNEIKGLTADRSILEYQLSVAERYGDEARAAKIRAELAKVNKNIADSEKKLAEAQANSSTELEGNSDAAIKNRAALLGMLGTYQSRIEMLAKLGFNQSELEDSSETLKKQFLAEAKALGFSGKQLEDYAALFDNFTEAASDAPRDVDVEVNPLLSAAEQAIQEFISKDRSGTPIELDVDADTDEADAKINTWLAQAREFKKPDVNGITADAADAKLKAWLNKMRYFQPVIADRVDTKPAETEIQKLLNTTRVINIQLKIQLDKQLLLAQAENIYKLAVASASNKTAYNAYIDTYRIINGIANRMATGGLVKGPGSGTSDSIPTMLSNGEYVVKASSVSAYGVDFFNALNQQRVGFSPASSMGGAMSQQGPSMVFLSPEDRQLLRQFGDRPVNLYADSTKIAEVANTGNTKMSRRGSR